MRHSRLAWIGLAVLAMGVTGADCIPPELLEPINCPNPAVTSFSVEVVSKSGTTGTIRFTGIVRNLGLQDFQSGVGQQSVQLYANSTLLAQVEFTNLASLAEVTLTHEIAWSSSTEFPPTYQLLIAYDPDIYIDNNPNNDDCNTTDNSAQLTGEQINTTFNAA